MAEERKVPVWTWRDAVRRADVPPLTKLVCYAIANYLADVGEGCFPSVKTIMADTGLSNRSVATHIENAAKAGLLKVERGTTGKDGRYQGSVYYPCFPANMTLPREPRSRGQFEDRVKEVHVAKPREARSRGPREPDDKNRVKEVHAELSIRKYPIRAPVRAKGFTSFSGSEAGTKPPAPSEGQVSKVDLKTLADSIAAISKQPAKPQPPLPVLRRAPFSLKPSAPSWGAWLDHLKQIERDDLAGEAADAGVMVVPSLWPPKEAAE